MTAEPDAGHPFDYFWRPGQPLRPPPSRAVPSDLWSHSRRMMFSPWIEVRDVPVETPRTRLFADHLWQGDELMDAVVDSFFRMGMTKGRPLLDRALDRGVGSLTRPPEELLELFDSLDTRPPWFDQALWERGRELWVDSSLAGRFAMAVYDGFGTLVGEEVSSATGATGMFVRNLAVRLLETAKWFSDATRPDLIERFSPAFKDTVRVRLMHAQARRSLRRSWGDEHFAHHGNPISNATTMGAAITFGLLPVLFDHAHGRRRSDDDLDAVMMYWNYIAHLFGVAEELIPASGREGIEIADYMIATAGGPTSWTGEILDAWTAPAVEGGSSLPSLSRSGALVLRPLLGSLAYFGGEPIVRALVRTTPARDLPFGPWPAIAGQAARLNVAAREVSDALPLASGRRRLRARRGDPSQRIGVWLLGRVAARSGVRAVRYDQHDRCPVGRGS